MRIGIGMAALAMGLVTTGAAQAQDSASQMRVGFDVCADFVAGRADWNTAVATANAAGFPGDGGAAMTWVGPGGQSRVRLSLASTGNDWCSIATSDPAVDGVALSDQAMGWAAERLEGPWRHARADQPTTADASAITGHNGRIGVTAARPNRGGVRVMTMRQTAAQWADNLTRLGASPVTLETPTYNPPALLPAPTGPSVRDAVLAALDQCYAFLAGGDRPALTEGGSGVRMSLSAPSARRACAIEVTAPPPDPALMTAGLQVIDRNRRGLSRSREEAGFSCIMHSVTVRSRDVEAVAACDRLTPSGQAWLSFQLTAVH